MEVMRYPNTNMHRRSYPTQHSSHENNVTKKQKKRRGEMMPGIYRLLMICAPPPQVLARISQIVSYVPR